MTKRATNAFQQAAQRQDPTVFDYACEVEQVWRNFPEMKARVYFLDIGNEKTRFIYPGDPEKKESILRWINGQSDLLSLIKQTKAIDKSSCHHLASNGEDSFILLYTQRHPFDFLTDAFELGQETAFVFDHELAHAIIEDGTDIKDRNLRECIADAYATIRHLQRYGADSAVIEELPLHRLFHWFSMAGTRYRDHFTNPVIEQILVRRYDIEWNSLSPAETVKLARRFALEYIVHSKKLEALDEFFKRFQGTIDSIKTGNITPFRELGEKVLSTGNPHFFKWGTAVLKMALDGKLGKSYGVTLAGDDWDRLRQKLGEKQQIFETQDKLLFGLGAADRPLQCAVAAKKVVSSSARKRA